MSVEHGEFTIAVEGRVIKSKMIGSFNEYGAHRYTCAVIEIVKSFNQQPFAMLIDNSELLGGTPEAYQVLEEYNIWVNQQNMQGKAFVFPAAIMATIMKNLAPSMRADNIKIFSSMSDATNWIASTLAECESVNA
ncbi:hypothetical protein [Shewanella gaetbuli]|uniref:Uncharacterized protein n=1 Tax=Shewanella gaetbuli TaxID=220752 RepID=A0A9X1ZNM1_9GAMM|nr:hypothetical protein [Shewanella gaetbuli]MCL1141208.1 hypothetical protein [Shewanella gaetbuli]